MSPQGGQASGAHCPCISAPSGRAQLASLVGTAAAGAQMQLTRVFDQNERMSGKEQSNVAQQKGTPERS